MIRAVPADSRRVQPQEIMTMRIDAADVRAAVSRVGWLPVLSALAGDVLEPALRRPGRHAPCPVHGGRHGDGFRLFADVATRPAAASVPPAPFPMDWHCCNGRFAGRFPGSAADGHCAGTATSASTHDSCACTESTAATTAIGCRIRPDATGAASGLGDPCRPNIRALGRCGTIWPHDDSLSRCSMRV